MGTPLLPKYISSLPHPTKKQYVSWALFLKQELRLDTSASPKGSLETHSLRLQPRATF